jgi:hypothetical protein
LEPRQVKFWFQNRCTQLKAHTECAENSMLRAKNEKLRSENLLMREALKNPQCPHYGGLAIVGEMSFDEQQLHIENGRLKEELDRVSALAADHAGAGACELVAGLEQYHPLSSPHRIFAFHLAPLVSQPLSLSWPHALTAATARDVTATRTQTRVRRE